MQMLDKQAARSSREQPRQGRTTGSREQRRPGIAGAATEAGTSNRQQQGAAEAWEDDGLEGAAEAGNRGRGRCGDRRQGIGLRFRWPSILPGPPPPPPAQRRWDHAQRRRRETRDRGLTTDSKVRILNLAKFIMF